MVFSLLVICVVVSDINGYFEVYGDGFGINVDVRMFLVDVVIIINCIRNDLLSVVEEVVCGMEGLVGGVEYVSKLLFGVVCL